jgi:hypothetical protein
VPVLLTFLAECCGSAQPPVALGFGPLAETPEFGYPICSTWRTVPLVFQLIFPASFGWVLVFGSGFCDSLVRIIVSRSTGGVSSYAVDLG